MPNDMNHINNYRYMKACVDDLKHLSAELKVVKDKIDNALIRLNADSDTVKIFELEQRYIDVSARISDEETVFVKSMRKDWEEATKGKTNKDVEAMLAWFDKYDKNFDRFVD